MHNSTTWQETKIITYFWENYKIVRRRVYSLIELKISSVMLPIKKYDFCLVEEKEKKELKGFNVNSNLVSFNLLLPPPNITGKLHLGHAFEVIIQDFIVRWEFLKGKKVNWIVGLDHAGIATQQVIERVSSFNLIEEKKNFTLNVWFPKIQDKFLEQWRSLGVLINRNSVLFTLDPLAQKQVQQAFIKLYDDGLIHRDYRLVNWDKKLKSVISDIEVENRAVTCCLYYLKYFLYQNEKVEENEYILVATSRPETIFADVAVFINPLDKRYKKFSSKKLVNPCGLIVPILEDEEIQISFGSGAMKCTPAHDFKDYNLAKKYDLPVVSCCDENGFLNELAGKWRGEAIWDIRESLVKELSSKGLLVKSEEYETNLPFSIQTNEIVEPVLSQQWFLDLPKLIQKSEKVLPNFLDKILFFPNLYRKKIEEWKEKAEKWCLSRQLWWGHRIPAWYHKKTKEIYVGESLFVRKEEEWEAEKSVLDTWFSSGLWSLISSSKSEIFPSPSLFPIDLLVTGYDILFFWVFKMIVLGVYFTGKIPFKQVCFHGLIRDSSGKKMSKSLGNGVDPQEIIDKYGSDSLRLFFCRQNVWGEDLIYQENKVKESWAFCQKLWSIANFIIKKVPLKKIRKINSEDIKS